MGNLELLLAQQPAPPSVEREHVATKQTQSGELSARITQYLCVGGLWNSEMMERDKVCTLLMDCREFLDAGREREQGLRDALKGSK